MPYVSCILVAAGMLVHFGIVLITFLTAKLQTLPTAAAAAGKVSFAQVLPWIVVGVIGLGLVARLSMSMAAASPVEGEMNLAEFGRLPVLEGGRVKPMDSLARDSLKIITGGRESFKDTAKNTQPAVVWLLDLLSGKLEEKTRGMRDEDRIPIAQLYPIFRIDNDQVVSLLGLDKKRDGHRYAINEFAGRMETLEIEARKANDADPKKRTAYQAKVIELAEHLQLYISIVRQEKVKIVPPRTAGFEWQSLRQAAREMIDNEVDNPPARYIAGMLSAYKDNKPTEFNRALDDYRKWLDGQATVDTAGASVEYSFYNTFQPFSWCMFLYVGVFALAASSWLVWTWRVPLARTAFWLAVLTLVLHSTALIGRMYLMDRWFVFVTNLYSSAIFIGMVGLGIALVLEVIFPLGVATAVAAVLGFVTTFIADYLSRSGDTLNMLQAVLDTNFWLATHVTCITFGYATTFLAGFLGIAYLGVAALIGPTAGINRGKTGSESGIDWLRILSLMIYGVVCFATLLSFVGTVLGGIWADQSWGRFWGWDPKENGALMIVLWNALILHARWSGMAKQMGVAILAVAGNMIVAWSWFGTNQLGVGLHAYGFNNTIATALVSAWAIHLAVIGAALFLVWKNRLSAPAV
jgi:ABC-type transport system involved in cytochrome c biogenesis permease subunit